jgi:TolA-binding protein
MRLILVTAILLAGAAAPSIAQQRPPVERRVDRLEQEMRAVQRRVFPNGAAAQVEPEIGPQTPGGARTSIGGSALSDLTARVDALEAQFGALTAQIEEANYRSRQAEEAVARLREESSARIARLEAAAAERQTAQPAAQPQREPERTAAATPATQTPAGAGPAARPADPAEEAYNAGFRLWEQRRYEEAQTALQAVAERYPRSRWASWASNLAGRAFLDDDKPATAARIFLANYQNNREGERAADSLFFLGEALTKLNRRPEACRVYDELAEVFPNMRDFIRTRLPAARREARCTG